MKIHKISKRLGRTITNKETFSSIKIENEIEVLLDEGETLQEAQQRLFDLVEAAIVEDYKRIQEKRKKNESPKQD